MHIFDYFFAHPEFDLKRCLYGHLKHFDNTNEYQFTTDSSKKCFYFINLEALHDISADQLQHLKNNFTKHPDNILIIDTTLEDFCSDNFYNLSNFCNQFIDISKIKVLTSCAPAETFKKTFNIHYECITYHFMETTFRVWTEQMHNDIKLKKSKPKKHFIAFMKNARPVRNIFHAFFSKYNLIDKSFYSWHNIGLAENWRPGGNDELIEICKYLQLIDNQEQIENLKTPIYYDDFIKRDEWLLPDECVEHGAIFCNFDTSNTMDITHNILYDEHEHTAFFTEKTFSPMCYKIPSLNMFSQTHFQEIKKLGYIPLDNILLDISDAENYEQFLKNQFARLLQLGKLSIDNVYELCISDAVKDALDHNYNLFLQQNQFKKIKDILKNLY